MRYYSEETVNEMLLYFARSRYFPIFSPYPSIEIPDSPWHKGTPTEVGRYLIVIPKVSIDVDKSVNFNNLDELSYELKIAEYFSGNSFEYSEKDILNNHCVYSVDCDKTLWMFINETNICSQMIMWEVNK